MSNSIHKSKSIAELHQGMGLNEPKHPLITVVDTAELAYGEEFVGLRFSSDMYCVALKEGGCGIDYGRNDYEFNEGNLIFTAPEQVFTVKKAQALAQVEGWMLYFHPDLIYKTRLANHIDHYDFFNYESRFALTLSDQEKQTLTTIINLIRNEIAAPLDKHCQRILVANIRVLLEYSLRFYERQCKQNNQEKLEIVARVESLLKDYYLNHDLMEEGQPSIQYLAGKCCLSANYLSDLLSKETGRSAKEHINDFLIDKAKHLLLSSNASVSEIAYTLGFNYPHYFSRLFKQKTGTSPLLYRQTS